MSCYSSTPIRSLPPEADRLVVDGDCAKSGRPWGRFDVTIASHHWLLPMVAWWMNLRSRVTGIATGDQAIFVTRQAFASVGGFPYIPLMEDIVISRRLKRIGRPLCLTDRVLTSGRRWEKHGVLRTILLMWRLRLAFFLGAEPERLARDYGCNSTQSANPSRSPSWPKHRCPAWRRHGCSRRWARSAPPVCRRA